MKKFIAISLLLKGCLGVDQLDTSILGITHKHSHNLKLHDEHLHHAHKPLKPAIKGPDLFYDEIGDPGLIPIGTCPDGFSLEGFDCISRSFESAIKQCPHGTKLQNDRCIEEIVEPATEQCPAGYTLLHHKCSKEYEFEVSYRCPHHYQIEDGKCRKIEKHLPSLACPKGSHLMPDGMCESIRTYDARASCPEGSILESLHKGGAVCVVASTFMPTYVCRDDQTLSNDECVAIRRDRAIFECPGPEFKLIHGNECIRSEVLEPELICEVGILKNGRCIVIDDKPIERSCEESFRHHEDLCVKELSRSPELFCHPKYKLVGNTCQLETKIKPIFKCPEGSQPIHHNRCLRDNASTTGISTCDEGYILNNDQCILETMSEPITKCPSGFIPDGDGKCVRRKYSKNAHSFNCPHGKRIGTKCITEEILEPIRDCSQHNGLQLDMNGMCTGVLHTPLERKCKHGIFSDGMCYKNSKIRAISKCPINMKLNHKGKCIEEKFYPALVKCPNDATNVGLNRCKRVETIGQELYCPGETVLDQGRCLPHSHH